MKFIIAITYCILAFTPAVSAQAYPKGDPPPGEKENLDVFQQWVKWNNPGSMLLHYLLDEAAVLYGKRDKIIAGIKTKEQWVARQAAVKKQLDTLLGPPPDAGPLNPRITGVIKRKGYRIEKLVYEAFPGSFVTGCVYVPEKFKGRAPAVLYLSGHDQEAYKVELYQIIITNLVKKGMIVLAIDPPGQGEHVQYFDTTKNFSAIGYTVVEHCYFGNQNFITGSSPAKYFVWEAIRGIDYLVSRKDVDAARIGVTGFSGGAGTTAYVSAIDERVKVSIPCSWPTASRWQIEVKAPADAENQLIGGLAKGISFEDLLEARAPKPTLLTFVSRDQYVSVQGAKESFNEAKKIYSAYGSEENIQVAEDDSRHWVTSPIRHALYSFFMKHFNIAGNSAEEPTDLLSKQELDALFVTPTGQISTSFGGDLIYDVNRKQAEKLIARLDGSRKDSEQHLATLKPVAIGISGYKEPGKEVECALNGRYRRDGYTISKYAIDTKSGYAIPFLLFSPDGEAQRHPAIVYVHSKGKAFQASPGGEIEQLTKKGFVVAAVDVLGIGEMSNTAARALSSGNAAVLIGRSIPAIQAADIVTVARHLKTSEDIDTARITAIATDELCIALLHAAAFDGSISTVILQRPLVSFRSVVNTRLYKMGLFKRPGGDGHYPYEVDFSWGIANILSGYDLPDLAALIAPRKLFFLAPKNAALEKLAPEQQQQELGFPKSVYEIMKVPRNLIVSDDDRLSDEILKSGVDPIKN